MNFITLYNIVNMPAYNFGKYENKFRENVVIRLKDFN